MNATSNVAVVDDVLWDVRRTGLGRVRLLQIRARCLSGCRRCVQPAMRMSPARCRHWLETVRPGRGAKPEVIHPDMSMIVCCDDCLLRVVARSPSSLSNVRKLNMMHQPQSFNAEFPSGIQ